MAQSRLFPEHAVKIGFRKYSVVALANKSDVAVVGPNDDNNVSILSTLMIFFFSSFVFVISKLL
jgi:hypothetical protein